MVTRLTAVFIQGIARTFPLNPANLATLTGGSRAHRERALPHHSHEVSGYRASFEPVGLFEDTWRPVSDPTLQVTHGDFAIVRM